MARYRLIGYYEDTAQVYDGTWEGEDATDAVANCRAGQFSDWFRGRLVLVAILLGDENVYEASTTSFIADWPTPKEDE